MMCIDKGSGEKVGVKLSKVVASNCSEPCFTIVMYSTSTLYIVIPVCKISHSPRFSSFSVSFRTAWHFPTMAFIQE